MYEYEDEVEVVGEDEIEELRQVIESGEFDFAAYENSEKEMPIFRLILAAYNAGRSINQ